MTPLQRRHRGHHRQMPLTAGGMLLYFASLLQAKRTDANCGAQRLSSLCVGSWHFSIWTLFSQNDTDFPARARSFPSVLLGLPYGGADATSVSRWQVM
jgi:hypothetical protein